MFDPAHPASDPNHPVDYAGDPVNTASGDFFHTHNDITIPGRGVPLSFTRYYHSGSAVNRYLGYGWTHSYDMYLEFPTGGVTIFYPDGHSVLFTLSGGNYVPRAGVYDTLVQNGGTYTLTTPGQIRYNFHSSGRLSSIKDRNDNETTLNYVGSLLSYVQDPGGRRLTFEYESNRIKRVIDPLSRTVEFFYDGNGDLFKVKDVKAHPVNGPFTVYEYSSHRMFKLTDSNNHVAVQNTYDDANRVVEQLDAVNGVTCFKYGTPPSHTTTTCPAVSPGPGESQTIVVDARSYKTTYTFDAESRTIDVTDHLTGNVHTDYDANHNPTCIRDQRGKKTRYSYDPNSNVTQIIDANNTDPNPSISGCVLKSGGKVWTFEYTPTNDIKKEIEPAIAPESGRRETEYFYDVKDNLTRIVRRDASANVKAVTCFERDISGQPNGWGQITAFIQSTDPGAANPCVGNRTRFGYDTSGNQTCIVNARFSATTNCSSPVGPKKTFIYDNGGRMFFVSDELGHSNSFSYDAQNNVLTATDGLWQQTTNGYDAKGLLRWTTDANGRSDLFGYDAADRLIETREGGGYPITYSYDAAGNRTSVTNINRLAAAQSETTISGACGAAGTGNGFNEDWWSDAIADDGCPSTVYAYDALNRLQSVADAGFNPSTETLGRTTSYQYDAASNLTQQTDARGLITKYFPDNLNRLELIEHRGADNSLIDTVNFTYDEVSNRKTMVDPTGTTQYNYDALNRPTSVVFPGPKTVGYTYDDLPGGLAADYPGQRTMLTYPDNKTVSYTYEKDGRMKTVTDWLSKQTTYSYDDAGHLTTTQLPNGVCTQYTYDAADRLTNVVNRPPACSPSATISSYAYTLDAVGNRTQVIEPSVTHTYEYRTYGPYSLTRATGTGPAPYDHRYDYDENGNRLFKHDLMNPSQSVGYSYDAADQMVSAGGETYGYDANGNQQSRGNDDTFVYDHENRLTQGTIDGVVSTSEYNGDGLRMNHTVTGQETTNYAWDVAAGLPVVLQDEAKSYVYGLDLISATDNSGAQTYFLYDGLGSTVNLTDGAGTTTATYAYDEFGATRSADGPAAAANEWRFTGEQRDGESNLYYLRARYYDPATGRFLSQDALPIGNPYAYALNNPTNLTDPSGYCPPTLCAPSVGGCVVAGPGGCVIGLAVGVGVTAAVVVCIAGACDALGDLVGAAGDIVGDVGDFLTGPFHSSSSRTKELEAKYLSDLGRAGRVIERIQQDPCNQYNRSHQERKLRGFLRNVNETGEKLKKGPVTYDPTSIPCTEFYVPLPWESDSSGGSSKE